GLHRGEQQERVAVGNERIDHPMVLNFQHSEEDRVVLRRNTHGAQEGRVVDGRLHRFCGPAPEDSLQESVFDLRHLRVAYVPVVKVVHIDSPRMPGWLPSQYGTLKRLPERINGSLEIRHATVRRHARCWHFTTD